MPKSTAPKTLTATRITRKKRSGKQLTSVPTHSRIPRHRDRLFRGMAIRDFAPSRSAVSPS